MEKKRRIWFLIIVVTAMIITGFILYGCSAPSAEGSKSETITTDVHITSVTHYKYSKVRGYIIYKDITLEIDNGSTGYYYKKYSLKPGDVVKKSVTVYQETTATGVLLSASTVNFSEYEIN
jgi:hypothetical protein